MSTPRELRFVDTEDREGFVVNDAAGRFGEDRVDRPGRNRPIEELDVDALAHRERTALN